MPMPWGHRAPDRPPSARLSSLGAVGWDSGVTFPPVEELEPLVSHVLASNRFVGLGERASIGSTIHVEGNIPSPPANDGGWLGRSGVTILRWPWEHWRSADSGRFSMLSPSKSQGKS